GHRGAGAQYPRLDGLRQDVPEADPPRLGRRRAEGPGACGAVAARAGLGRPGTDRRLWRVVRRVRDAVVREPSAGLLGLRRGPRWAVEPGDLREGRPADVAPDDGAVGWGSGDGSGLPDGALPDHVRRPDHGAALRHPG